MLHLNALLVPSQLFILTTAKRTSSGSMQFILFQKKAGDKLVQKAMKKENQTWKVADERSKMRICIKKPLSIPEIRSNSAQCFEMISLNTRISKPNTKALEDPCFQILCRFIIQQPIENTCIIDECLKFPGRLFPERISILRRVFLGVLRV